MSVYVQTGFAGDEYDLTHPRVGYDAWGQVNAQASSAAAGFAALNASSTRVDSAWRPTAFPADWYTVFSRERPVEYIAIGAHDLGTQNAIISVQTTSNGGTSWATVPGLGDIAPTDNSAIFCLIDPVVVDGYRVRIRSADDFPTIGRIVGGRVMEWPRRAVWTGTPITESDRITFANNISDTGAWLGRTRTSDGLEFQVQIDNLSEDFRTGDFKAFKNYANGEGAAFFIATRPGDYPDEVAYAWATDVVRMPRNTPNRRISGSVTLNLTGYRQDLT